jgi:FtsZ-binding cell division protein ZapB
MELNRKQALEILEKFDFFLGQIAGRELWQSKPFEVQEQDIANFSRDVTLIIDYIKELTEENANLHISCAELTHECASLNEENERLKSLLDDRCDRCIERNRANTVREIQTRFAMHFGTYTYQDIVKVRDVFRVLDEIAKEILGGKK